MIEQDTRVISAFYRKIRDFVDNVKYYDSFIKHEVTPDEIWDMSLVSLRVYGRRDEFIAVMAAAGIGIWDEPLKVGKVLILPIDSQLSRMKIMVGFESIHDRRTNYAPDWI